jgi:hypothetical protein
MYLGRKGNAEILIKNFGSLKNNISTALSHYRPVLILRPPFASSELSNFDAFYSTILPG